MVQIKLWTLLLYLFLYTIYSTNPGMYDELTNPAKTCKGVFQTGRIRSLRLRFLAIAYAVTALISGGTSPAFTF